MKVTKSISHSRSAQSLAASIGLLLFPALNAVHAGTQISTQANGKDVLTQPSTRYGLFGWLDHRSAYGQGAFPEPFLVDDSDHETNEARVDWFHTGGAHQQTDSIKAEIEKGVGPVTLELEVPWERDWSEGHATEGMANIDVGARVPIFQYVSTDGSFDETFGVGIELGIPTHSSVSRNTELVPKVFNDLKLGEHFTMQTVLGYSMIYGIGDDGGLDTFEYGFTFGWTIPHNELPLPGVQQFVPVFEISGERQINHDKDNSVLGMGGFRINLNAIGSVQPRLGAGYVFPMNSTAHEEVKGGVYVSLVFEY